jgi:hypothetical protein
MVRKAKEKVDRKAAKAKVQHSPVQRYVAPDRIQERQGQGWKLVNDVPPMRNGSVLMVKE